MEENFIPIRKNKEEEKRKKRGLFGKFCCRKGYLS